MNSLILPTRSKNWQHPMSIFEDFFNSDLGNRNNVPSTNIRESDINFLIEVAAPGFNKDSFNVEIENNYLKVSSKREFKNNGIEGKYHRKEFSYSAFERSFYLPDNLNAEEIKASYNDGILSVTIPKKVKLEKSSKIIEIQ